MPEIEMRKSQESTPRLVWLFSGHMIDAPDVEAAREGYGIS